ncbi:N-acetyltransferase [Roseivivax sediminis]|nr:GNAT family N-acetyltransferase [Roseivivax sediminis]
MARVHVQSWPEAYRGALPEAEERRPARGPPDASAGRWPDGDDRAGPGLRANRAAAWQPAYPSDLWYLYVLARPHGAGIGRRLLSAALRARPGAFSACMPEGNSRAFAFYRKTGAQLLETRRDRVGTTSMTAHILGWPVAEAARPAL